MKYKFNVTIRGNVDYDSQSALQSAIAAQLEAVAGFTKTSSSIEAWQADGALVDLESGLHRYTIQLSGNILAGSETDVEAVIAGFTTAYSEFTLTFQSVTAWLDGDGNLRQYNDDGTVYDSESTEEVVTDLEVEEVEDESAAEGGAEEAAGETVESTEQES